MQKKPNKPKKQPDYSKAPPSSLKLMGRYVPTQKKKHPLIQLFCKTENQLEDLLKWLESLALIQILSLVGNTGLIIAAATYVGSEKQRRDAEVLSAWQTITSAYEQGGNGGRIQALEFLNASPGANWRRKFPWFCAPVSICVWPAQSLSGVDLSRNTLEQDRGDLVIGVYLAEIELPQARLRNANFRGAFLRGANLQNALLRDADFRGAYFIGTNLQGATLWGADFRGAKSLKTEQITQAKLCFTKLPTDIDLPPNRDCAELGIDPETGKPIVPPK